MYERTYGNKYIKGMDVAEIAKLVRQDIREAIASGKIPRVKCSVRIERFSGGRSIDVRIVDVPAGFCGVRQDFFDERDRGRWIRYRTEEAESLLGELNSILNSYNYDGSETQVDYFDVNFYGTADFDWRLESRLEAEAEAEWRRAKSSGPREGASQAKQALADSAENTSQVCEVSSRQVAGGHK